MFLFIVIVVIVILVVVKADKDANRYLRDNNLQVNEVNQTEQIEDTDEYVYVENDDKHEYEFDENGAMLVPKFKYSEQELAEYEKYEELADEIQENGHKLPRRYKTSWAFHAYMVVAIWAGFFMFTAVYPVYVAGVFPSLGEDSGFYKLSWDYIVGGLDIMALTASVLLVFFAVVGVTSVIAWIVFIFSDKSREQEVIEMMNKTYMIIGISLQKCEEEAKKKMAEDLEREKQAYMDALATRDAAANKAQEQEIKELTKHYKRQIDEMQKDFAREKKLLNFDIKELKMELRKHKALAKELDDN